MTWWHAGLIGATVAVNILALWLIVHNRWPLATLIGDAWWRLGWWVAKTYHCRVRRRHRWWEDNGGTYCNRCGLLLAFSNPDRK